MAEILYWLKLGRAEFLPKRSFGKNVKFNQRCNFSVAALNLISNAIARQPPEI